MRPPTLTLEGGTVAVDTGCNTGRGSYTIAGDAVTFGPIATTRMACDDRTRMQVEQQVLTVLTGTATYAIDAAALTLTNGANGLVARVGRARRPPASSDRRGSWTRRPWTARRRPPVSGRRR